MQTKPLVFVKTKVKINDGRTVDSWELISFGNSPVMHAAWNPQNQKLACQLNSVKENFVDFPSQSKAGKVTWSERRAEQYYRLILEDLDAIEFILKNYVANFTDQEWNLSVEPIKEIEKSSVEEFNPEELVTES